MFPLSNVKLPAQSNGYAYVCNVPFMFRTQYAYWFPVRFASKDAVVSFITVLFGGVVIVALGAGFRLNGLLNRQVRIEGTHYYTAANVSMLSIGTITNPNNANDSNWATAATYSSGGIQYFNYTLSQLYETNWTVKDTGATRNIHIPDDCMRPTLSLRVHRPGAIINFNYSCYNYSSESYINITTTPMPARFTLISVSFVVADGPAYLLSLNDTELLKAVPKI